MVLKKQPISDEKHKTFSFPKWVCVCVFVFILQIDWTQSDFNYNGMINGHFIYLWNLLLSENYNWIKILLLLVLLLFGDGDGGGLFCWVR